MKVLVFVFMLICASKAIENKYISIDEIETYLDKFISNHLTKDEESTLRVFLEVLSFEISPVTTKFLNTSYHIDYQNSSVINIKLRCLACRAALKSLFKAVTCSNFSDEYLIKMLTKLCVLLKIQSTNVCKGAIELHLEPKTNKRSLKVAILSDVHIDPIYKPYGVANCDEPTCCRNGQKSTKRSFLEVDKNLYDKIIFEESGEKFFNLSVASEIRHPKNLQLRVKETPDIAQAGFWGDYRKCDTPVWAYDDVINRIAKTHRDIDIVYYLGDTIDHGIWAATYDLNKKMNSYLIEKLRNTFGRNVLVVPVIGNHEAQPTNQFAPISVAREHNTTWLYEALAERWAPYLTYKAMASLLVRGSFSLSPRPGFKIISINNNVALRYNWWVIYDPLDAKHHLDWLIQELYKSELVGEKVHILAHVPPGVQDLTYTWTREYNRIVNRFSSTIAAEFNGHEHTDGFKVFYSGDGSPINVAWNAGGLSTYKYFNPNYKIVDIDSSTFEPISMQSYSFNLTEANLHPNRRPQWFQLYDLKKSFDLPNLSPKSIDNLINSMSLQNNYLDLYSQYSSKLSDIRWPQCNQECKTEHLCNTVITVLWDRQKCEKITT